MKEYLEKRIKELESEKDLWLSKMNDWNESIYKQNFSTTILILDELYELKRIGDEENELHSN